MNNTALWGTIIARQPDTDAATRAGDVVYTARAVVDESAASFQVVGVKPLRIYADDELIHPAKVGTPCILGRVGARNVIMVQERVAIAECPE